MVFTEETALMLAGILRGKLGSTLLDPQVLAHDILDFLVEYGEIDFDSEDDE